MNENNENKEFWAINSVIFRKPYDLQLAVEEAKKFITSGSKKRPHETKTSYRFRNLNRKKFIKGSFRTKRINKNISLVMGQLKPEHGHLEGAGIFDLFKKPIKAVREFFSPRQGLNNTSTKTLKTYGAGVIDGLTIARTPIESLIDKTLNLISFGKWAQLKKEYKFDELFHLALIVKIGNKNIIVEKNEVINISTSYKMSSKTETLDVPLNGKKITLDQLIDNTKNFMGKDFIPYDGFKNNCQFFIRAVLQSNGLYGEQEKNFLFQDLEELSKKMPWLTKKIMNLTTHTGAVVNKIMGKGAMEGGIGKIIDPDRERERRMLLLRNKHNKIVSQILADHMSKFYTNLQDVYNEIESETNNKKKTALQTKYKKKFKLKTNEELNKFLIENSPLTQEQNNEELQEIHKEYNELQEKMSLKNEFKMDEKEVKPTEEFKNIRITKLDELTIKNLRQIAKAFNEHMLIEKFYTMNKEDLINELLKHLEIIDGMLHLRPHIFELIKKNKKGSEIEVEVEVERINRELEKINKEYLPIAKAKEDSEAKIKAEYMEKYGYPDLMKFYRQIESGVLEVGSELYKKLRNKFGVKTKKELMTYLREHNFENFERNHPSYNYEGKDKHTNLYNQQYKLKVGSNPENVKKRLEMEKKLKELGEIEAKQKEIVKRIKKDNIEQYGEDLDDLSQRFNYFSYNEKNLSKAEKEEKVKLQKDLKKKFKIRTNDLLWDFINKNKPSILKSENEEYSKLRDEAYKLWGELTKMPESPYYNSNQYYGYGKKDLGDEFKMDEADHEKKLAEFEKSMPSQEIIRKVLKDLKHMTNSNLTHINKLEELVGGSAKSTGFIRAIMSGKDKKEPNQFKNYNQEGFNELKITNKKLTQASGDLVRRRFKDKDYKKFVLFLSLPSANDLYNNNEMRDLYLGDKKKAHEAIEQVEKLIHNEENMEKAINEKYPKFKDLDVYNKEIVRHQYKQAVIASIMSKYYNKLAPIVGEITTEMNERINENQKRYRGKKKNKEVVKDDFNNEEFQKYWEQVRNLKKGEEMEPFQHRKVEEKEVKEKEMTREQIDKELKNKLKEFKSILKKNKDIRTPLPKKIKKPKFDYKNASATQKEVNNVVSQWLARQTKEKPEVETVVQGAIKKESVDDEKIKSEIRKLYKKNLSEDDFKSELLKIQKKEDLSNNKMRVLAKSAFILSENIKSKIEEKQAIKKEEEAFDELQELLAMAQEYDD